MILSACKNVSGEIFVPGDKSISHRAIMFGSIAKGITEIDNFLFSKDCISTINCFKSLGINIEFINKKIKVYGKGLYGLTKPKIILDAQNSGTTARLILGILSGQNFTSKITGDRSLKKRPMKRVTYPLTLMGAKFKDDPTPNNLPITIYGTKLKGINYSSKISSAQVKSSILFASLYAKGCTTYSEPSKSRNHTELMLKYFGGDLKIVNNTISSSPVSSLNSQHLIIPGDISSASFFIALTLLLQNSQLIIKNIGINPSRTGILQALKQMKANFKIENRRFINNELVGDISAFSSNINSITIEGEIIPKLIDEIPIIAVLATKANGTTIIKDAQELKVKESNRINSIVTQLAKMGADIIETFDGMVINGPCDLKGTIVDSQNDHRIAMALSIAAKIAYGQTTILNSECVDISFPNFFKTLNKICN